MASVMASRFSVLKIEDDSDQEREKAARKKAAEDEKAKKKTNKKKKKSKTTETADAELQSMAFGLPKPKQQAKQQKQQQQQSPPPPPPPPPPPKAGSESSRKASESEQNEWERRDQALIDEAFERDLQQAMIMSRVELERAATEAPPEASANGHHEPTAKAKAKKAKSNVLSVDQLQTLSTSQIDRGDFRSVQPAAAAAAPSRPPLAAAGGGGDFFDQVERKTKEAVNREKIIERIRQDLPPSQAGASPSALAVPPEVGLRLATAESRVEELTAELEETRDQVRQAKSRTKRVLSVLTQSETREKVQLIVGLEKAQAARDAADKERAEMSAQVTALLAQLEQERSKVHQLTTQLKRAQGNKRRGQSENDTADGVD